MQTISLEKGTSMVLEELEDFSRYLRDNGGRKFLQLFEDLSRNLGTVIHALQESHAYLLAQLQRLNKECQQKQFGQSSELAKYILNKNGASASNEGSSDTTDTTTNEKSSSGGSRTSGKPQPSRVANHSATDREQKEVLSGKSHQTATSHQKGKTNLLAESSLPRLEDKFIEFPEDAVELICPWCGERRKRIGWESHAELLYVPGYFTIRVVNRAKYGCLECQGADATPGQPSGTIITVPNDRIYPQSLLASSTIAYLITSKCDDHLPMYRLEEIFLRNGFPLPRSTISSAFLNVAETLDPIRELFLKLIQRCHIVNMDETTVRIKHNQKKEVIKGKSYFWLIHAQCNNEEEKYKIVYLRPGTRAEYNIHNLLGSSWEGFLQTDGYNAYTAYSKANPNVTHVACLAHIRRKFVDEIRTYSKEEREKMKDSLPVVLLCLISRIFRSDRKIREQNLSDEATIAKRQEIILPIFEEFYDIISKGLQEAKPDGPFWKAMNYALNLKEPMLNYLKCPALTPSNNIVERLAKTIAVGRHNWLFCHSWKGAEAIALFYSLIETAKANGLNPFDWLSYLFEEYPAARRHDLVENAKAKADFQAGRISQQELDQKEDAYIKKLLPWNCKEKCKSLQRPR